MINELKINEFVDKVYSFEYLGLEDVDLVIDSDEGIFITTEDAFFPNITKESFKIKGDSFFIINENDEVQEFTADQVEEIFKILDSGNSNE